jgi:hypothetical protein
MDIMICNYAALPAGIFIRKGKMHFRKHEVLTDVPKNRYQA